MQVWQQLSRPFPASDTVRKEVYKAAMATWLFVSFVAVPTDEKPPSYQALDARQKELFDKIMRNVWVAHMVVVVVVV